MSFLKKILKRVNKNSKTSGFNLKKYAKKKLAYLEEGELGAGLTPLQQFEAPVMSPEEKIDPSVSVAMEKYIDQNANAFQINPMPPEWIENENLRMHFQTLAGNILGNMADSFVGNAFEATNVSNEAPTAQVPQAPQEPETWQSLGDFDIDLVEAFLSSPNIQQTIGSISNSIMQSGYRQGIDRDTAEEVALEAARVALGQPGVKQRGGGSRRDQRFNYFLANPDKMPVDIAKVFYEQTSGAKPDEAIEFLKTNYGEILIQSLHEQITNDDPSIKQWVLKNSGNVGKSVIDKSLGTSLTGGEERGSNLQDTDIASLHKNRVEQREDDKRLIDSQSNELTKAAMAFAKLYIQDVARDMSEVMSSATEHSYKRYPNKSDKIERMQMFNKRIFDQYIDVFNSVPYIDKHENITFKNKHGQVSIPQDVLIDIFKGNMDKNAEELSIDILEQRTKGKTKFDLMKWFSSHIATEQKRGASSSILSHSSLQDNYKDAFNIKTSIIEAVQNNPPDEIAKSPGNVFKGIKGMGQGKMLEAFDKFSNADGDFSTEEKIERRLRYITETVEDYAKRRDFIAKKNEWAQKGSKEGDKPIDSSTYGIYEKYATMKEKVGVNPVNSMRPNAQYDVRYLMEGLDDVYNDPDTQYKGDVYQAFLGSLNPHVKVKDHYYPDIYKKLTGIQDEDVKENTSMLTDPERKYFLKLEQVKNDIERSRNKKQNVIDAEKNKAERRATSHHNRIQRAYKAHLTELKNQGINPITIGEYVGVPDWDGKRILEKEDYLRILRDRGVKISKIINGLWGAEGKEFSYKEMPPMQKIEKLEDPIAKYVKDEHGQIRLNTKDDLIRGISKDDPMEVRIDSQSLPVIEQHLQDIENKISEFKTTHNMSDSQYNMASALCRGYLTKMANIESLRCRYLNMKIASDISALDSIASGIEKSFQEDFDNIFRM